jgi:glutathione S-transferase
MKLYYFPSPNPQKVRFAIIELGLDCEIVNVDLTKGEHRQPAYLALNPFGRVPTLVDGELTLAESHAILAYLGEKTGKAWPASPAGRANALKWLFFLSAHITPPTTELVFNRLAVKVLGLPADEDAIARGEKVLPTVLLALESHLAKSRWLLGEDFTLVECAYGPILNAIEKAGLSYDAFPKVHGYLEAIRSRRAWNETPRLPML